MSHLAETYTVGWISALSVELAVARELLDEVFTQSNSPKIDSRRDENIYYFGRIYEHYVVIACLPKGRYGLTSSALVAERMLSNFPALRFGLMVGIGGGAPGSQDIRLGDIVVSTPTPRHPGVLQFDFGKTVQGHGFEETGHLAPPPELLLQAIAKIEAEHKREQWRGIEIARGIQRENPAMAKEFAYPGNDNDRLYESTYIHENDCECEKTDSTRYVVARRTRTEPENSIVHYGLIASSNQIMKDAIVRDDLTRRYGVSCFETEAAGLMNNFPCLVIRGICDYSDSHKNKRWQGYAATVAAIYAKEVLRTIPGKNVGSVQSIRKIVSQLEEQSFDIPLSLDGIPLAREFVGRHSEMHHLQFLLPSLAKQRRKIMVLSGLGGIGKTQLAIEFMRSHQTDFSAIFWLDGSSLDTLMKSIAAYAGRIVSKGTLNDSSPSSSDANVEKLLTWLSKPSNNKWLLIFDNIDRDYQESGGDPLAFDIQRFLPKADHGSIIITTRLTTLDYLGVSHEIQRLDDRVAREIIESQYTGHFDEDDMQGLLDRLDGLPLALVQAAAYLRESAMDIKSYLRFYDQRGEEVAELLFSSPLKEYSDRSVWTTWTISYNTILSHDKYTAHLLILWSFLDRNDLWYGVFEQASKRESIQGPMKKWLGSIPSQEPVFVEAMRLLRRYSLIQGSNSGGTYSIHAVVHRWMYFYQGLSHRWNIGLLAVMAIGLTAGLSYERDYLRLDRRLLPHVNQYIECVFKKGQKGFLPLPQLLEMGQLSENEIASRTSISRSAHLLITCNKLSEAKLIYEYVLQNIQQSLGPKHPWTLEILNELGWTHLNQDQMVEAETLFSQVLQNRIEILGPMHFSTLLTAEYLAETLLNQGKLAKAEKLLLRVLAGAECAEQSEWTHKVKVSNLFASLYMEQGRLREAEQIIQRSWQQVVELTGPSSIRTLLQLANVGYLYKLMGRLEEAELAVYRSVEEREDLFGAEHAYTIFSRGLLGAIYSDQGRFDEAEQILVQAVHGLKKSNGTDHSKTLRRTMYLGINYQRQGRLHEAGEILAQTLRIQENNLGASSSATLETLGNLAAVYKDQGRLSDAEKMCQRALDGFTTIVGNENVDRHPVVINVMRTLGDILITDRPEEAMKMYTRALSGCRVNQGPSSKTCLELEKLVEMATSSNKNKHDQAPNSSNGRIRKFVRGLSISNAIQLPRRPSKQ